MKKEIIMILSIILLTGCGKKDELIGKWTTRYELGMYGEITQIYEFQKKGGCKKTLITDMIIEKDCTYEKKEDSLEIRYNDNTKQSIQYRMENDKLILGGYEHIKE